MRRFLLAVALFTVASNPAMAKGGTNMHEMASSRHDNKPNVTNSIYFTGCSCGRYRNYRTHKYIIPADFWR
jgi:hypothetical protein